MTTTSSTFSVIFIVNGPCGNINPNKKLPMTACPPNRWVVQLDKRRRMNIIDMVNSLIAPPCSTSDS